MKTEAIKQQILDNYRQLFQLAHVEPKKENIIPVLGISYKRSGFVNQIGVIKRGRSAIRITNENGIQLEKKPFYMTWKRVLKNINTMLQNTIENIDNKDIVTKKVVNVLCFPQDMLKRIAKLSKH